MENVIGFHRLCLSVPVKQCSRGYRCACDNKLLLFAVAVVVCFFFFVFPSSCFCYNCGATKEISLVSNLTDGWPCLLFALHYTLEGQLLWVPELNELKHLHTELLKHREEFFVDPIPII